MSSQNAPQELSDMRTSQPVETDQPKAQSSMGKTTDSARRDELCADPFADPQKAPETTEPSLELRGGGACDGRLCGVIPCPIPVNCWIIPCPCC
uniref:WGS project CBMI000000000 data, contig CS3069_c002429 n=1 Tax=Fusarium clavum TaxID=2594811 RepID=A0A090MCU5_9HYPO|nr:unnamed protein product [Fusarium clavum]CEG05846.1 unnamed protein product [Fusarium clavum]